MTDEQLTAAQRDTLAIVNVLATRGRGAIAWQVGRKLDISESAAAARLRTLREKGLVTYGGRRPLAGDAAPHVLTDAGRRLLVWGDALA